MFFFYIFVFVQNPTLLKTEFDPNRFVQLREEPRTRI